MVFLRKTKEKMMKTKESWTAREKWPPAPFLLQRCPPYFGTSKGHLAFLFLFFFFLF
jgi:hypothetical protein